MVIKVNQSIGTYKRKLKNWLIIRPSFFWDYFNKHYPLTHTELGVDEATESAFIEYAGVNNVQGSELPVDVVFTWVDNTDPKWQQNYQYHKSKVDLSLVG